MVAKKVEVTVVTGNRKLAPSPALSVFAYGLLHLYIGGPTAVDEQWPKVQL